jgi:hypothetical protein
MRFRKIFENKDVEDLTHEVLTQSGFEHHQLNYTAGLKSAYYSFDPLPGTHHGDLQSIGWKKNTTYTDTERGRDDGFDNDEHWAKTQTHVYHHPDHEGELHVTDVTHHPDIHWSEDNDRHSAMFKRRGATYR